MNIGIVCYPTFGGSGVVATELGKCLASRGHQVHFICYRHPVRLADLVERIHFHEVSVSDYPLFEFPPYEMALTGRIVDVCRREELDVLHAHYAIPHAMAAIQARTVLDAEGAAPKVVTTLHGTDITVVGREEFLSPVVGHAIAASDAVTAVSCSLRSDTVDLFRIEKPIKVVHNFVDTDAYTQKEPRGFRRRFAPDGEFLVAHVSNFRPVKRLEDVIQVFARIREQVPARLLLVGDGPERGATERHCRQLGLMDSVEFLGKLRTPERVMAVSDLFLLPSEQESFGLAALEAMACATPVISTDSGGLSELNVHGESGFVSPLGDVDDMAANALHALGDEDRLRDMKDRARRRAELFSSARIVSQYEAIYSDLVGGASPPSPARS